ncbi:MAG: hypothetical protein ACT4P5_09390 [Armatimonadota bacterium]
MSTQIPVAEEFYGDSEVLRRFIGEVKKIMISAASAAQALPQLRVSFVDLLAERRWLPQMFRQPAEQSGMGGGIGQWLLYRSADRTITLFSLVVPPGSATPVHDHLAWGLVGLYDGAQEERIYRLVRSLSDGRRELELTKVRYLDRGDFYALLPPDDDIHSVRTTSPTPSVSLHLLARDVGCIWRHKYHPEEAKVELWRSGYVNAPCEDEPAPKVNV